MKKILLSMAFAGSLFAADVLIKTAGTTASDNGLSVQNSASTEVLSVEGDGTVKAPIGRISDKSGLLSPVGSVTMFVAMTAPTGWLICDGRAVSRTTYADLFALIGTTYGTEDDSTFNLPDMRGRGAIGYKSDNTKFDTLGEKSGEETHTLTVSEMPSHNHTVDPASFNASAAEAGNHNHTVDPATFTAIAASAGAHSHNVKAYRSNGASDSPYFGRNTDTDSYSNVITDSAGAHTHTVAVDVPNTTSTTNGDHTHTVAVDVPSTTSTSSSSGTAHNILDPYIVMNYIIKY